MKMKNRMKKNSLKFFSVFLSLFLWGYVLNSEKVRFEKTVTIEYILPDDMLFAQKPLQEAVFVIEGPRAFVKSINDRDDKLVIDLNKANRARRTEFNVSVTTADISLPFGMVVEQILPRKIPIRLEKKAGKIVPVTAQFVGELPKGMSLAKFVLSPEEVEVIGPRTQINKLKELTTRPIELENLVGGVEIPVEIQFPDERYNFESPVDMKLIYSLEAANPNLVLTDVPIQFLSKQKNVSSRTKSVTLKLLVPPKQKDRKALIKSVQVWADIPPGAFGIVEVPLKSIVPSGVHTIEISPKSIIVNVK